MIKGDHLKTTTLSRFLLAVLLLQGPVSSFAQATQITASELKPAPKWDIDLSGRWSVSEGKWQYEASLDADGNGPYQRECGRFTTTSVSGRTWTGLWTQAGNDREGGFSVELSEDGQAAEGRWWYTRVGEHRNIPPGERGGLYHWKRLPPLTAGDSPASAPSYPEEKTRELTLRMNGIAAELMGESRGAGEIPLAAPPSYSNGLPLSVCEGGTGKPPTGVPLPGNGRQGPVWDPWETWNRFWFSFNLNVDNYLMQPFVKNVFNPVVPETLRRMISNGFQNLEVPETIVAELLQGKFAEDGQALARFLINTTLGVAGMFDVAQSWFGIEMVKSNLEQVAATWGVPPGPYLVMPFAPPSNLRDTIIWALKQYFSPYGLILAMPGRLGLEAAKRIDQRSLDALGRNEPEKLYEQVREDSSQIDR